MAPRNRIAEILLKAGVLDEAQLTSALSQLNHWGGRLAQIIVERKLADEEAVVAALSAGLQVPRTHLDQTPRDAGALAKVEASFAQEKCLFPVALRDQGKTLVVAMADPTDLQAIDELAKQARTRVVVTIAGPTEITHAIQRLYSVGGGAFPATRSGKSTHPPVPEEEFKITDMSGTTTVKAAGEIASSSGGSASDLLDDMLSGGTPGFTSEELARVEAVRVNQEKSARILDALKELLTEKGYLAAGELDAKIRR